MSHIGYTGSYTNAFELIMRMILRPKSYPTSTSPLVYPHLTSPYYRLEDNFNTQTQSYIWRKGDIHGGIDFNYIGGQTAVNAAGENPVYAPVTGTVEGIQPDGGGVIIKRDADGTFHRL